MYEKFQFFSVGLKIIFVVGKFVVFNDLIIFYIWGDGIGVDIWFVMELVINVAIVKVYGGERKINWFKVYVGDEVCELYGIYQYLLEDILIVIKEYGVVIKGFFIILVGGGICFLNVVLR